MSDPFGDLDETLGEEAETTDEETTDETDESEGDDSTRGGATGATGQTADETETRASGASTGDTDVADTSGTEPGDSETGGDDTTSVGSEETGEPARTRAGSEGVSGDDAETDDGESEHSGAGLSEPAFPFAESDQRAVYPRTETWSALEDFLDFEVRRQLREHGVRDDTKRELHEAAFQVVQRHADEVAEQFLANRREGE